MIDVQYRKKIYPLLKEESPYDIILAELEEGKTEVKKNDDVYKKEKECWLYIRKIKVKNWIFGG